MATLHAIDWGPYFCSAIMAPQDCRVYIGNLSWDVTWKARGLNVAGVEWLWVAVESDGWSVFVFA